MMGGIIEVKFDYLKTVLLQETYRPKEEILEEVIRKEIKLVERSIKESKKWDKLMSPVLGTKVDPFYTEGLKKGIQEAKQALRDIEHLDFVFSVCGGYLLRLLSDGDSTKIRIYDCDADPLGRGSQQVKMYVDMFRDAGFEINVITKEKNIGPYWFDFYGFLKPEKAEIAYGKDNIRVRPRD